MRSIRHRVQEHAGGTFLLRGDENLRVVATAEPSRLSVRKKDTTGAGRNDHRIFVDMGDGNTGWATDNGGAAQ
jgi:hypothetical protein